MEPLHAVSEFGLSGRGEEPLNAYLGVSFSKTAFFSGMMMSRYIDWSCTHYREMLIIVADHLETYNKQVFSGLSFEDAEAATRRTGQQYCKSYLKAIPQELSERVTVRLVSDILAEPGCVGLVSRVYQETQAHPDFLESIRDTVLMVSGNKLADYGFSGQKKQWALDRLENYLIEEIGVILYITCLAQHRYQVSIFPYPPPPILLELYSGRFAELFSDITGKQEYKAIELIDGS